MISITAINGSARSEKGITSKLLNAFIKGLQENSELMQTFSILGRKPSLPVPQAFIVFIISPAIAF